MSTPHDLIARDRLAVIVLSWNNAKDTIRCVASLASWWSKPEVYVVDNASADHGIREIEARFPFIKIIRNEKNPGFAGGNNVGIKKALEGGADEILLLNNDAIVAEADVSRLLTALRERPDIAAIGPRIRAGGAVLAGGKDIGRHVDMHVRWSPGMGAEGSRASTTSRGRCSWSAPGPSGGSGCWTKSTFSAGRSPTCAGA
jgi:glycosyltransferase involved in cell wall biosynthesis